MTPDQQSLLHALLPEPLEIVPTAASPPGDNPWVDRVQMNPASRANREMRPSNNLTPRSILSIAYGPNERAHLSSFVGSAQIGTAQGWGHEAAGEIFDLVTGGSPEHLVNTLDKLEELSKK